MSIKVPINDIIRIRLRDDDIIQVRQGRDIVFSAATLATSIVGYNVTGDTDIIYGQSYNIVLTPLTGYQALPWNTKVIMNGVDITSTAYNSSTGAISIANVTGDVSIEAEAVEMSDAYKPVEYISTRAAAIGNMITLPYHPNNNTKLVMDLLLLSKTYSCLYTAGLASSVSPNYFFWATVHNTTVWRLKHGNAHQDTTSLAVGRIKFGERIIFSNDKGTIRYKNQSNGVYLYTYNGGIFNLSSINLGIMASSNSQSASESGYPCNGNLWKVEVSENGVMLLNYYPCKRISDNAVGIYDTVNGNAIINSNYIAPYIAPTRSYTNCAATLLSDATTGATSKAVIGSTWSIKITPTSGYTFTGGTTTQVEIDGVDVTSTTVTDNGDGTYTVTIVNVPDKPISISAAAIEIPYDAEVEYLESDGYEWIDTGILPTLNTFVESDFMITGYKSVSGKSYSNFFGFRYYDGTLRNSFTLTPKGSAANTYWWAAVGTISTNSSKTITRDVLAHVEMSTSSVTVTVGGTSKTLTFTPIWNTEYATLSLFIFSMNIISSDGAYPAIGRVYNFKITDNNVVVRDFIPVRKDGVGYLYDKVSGQMFGNANSSGAFTYGNDVSAVQSNSLLSGSLVSPSDTPDEPNDLDPIDMEDM